MGVRSNRVYVLELPIPNTLSLCVHGSSYSKKLVKVDNALPKLERYNRQSTCLGGRIIKEYPGPLEAGRLGRLEPPHIFTYHLRLHVIEKD